ncbi:DUF3467 domain-containing protein [Candidatus Saganbacteria bacterium]|nr:DUF3467 domain-containing protein [Candidatus Saganbacteria bacterium]
MGDVKRYYSNLVSITTTPTEVVLDFEMLTKEHREPKDAEKVVSVVLNPGIAASLVNVLGKSIKEHTEKIKKLIEEGKK